MLVPEWSKGKRKKKGLRGSGNLRVEPRKEYVSADLWHSGETVERGEVPLQAS